MGIDHPTIKASSWIRRKEIGIKVTNSHLICEVVVPPQSLRNRGVLTKKDSLVVQGDQCFCALCSLVCRMKPFDFYDIIYIFLMHAQTFSEKCNVWTN